MSEDKPKQNARTIPTQDEQPSVLPSGFSIGTVKGRHYDGDKIVVQRPDGK